MEIFIKTDDKIHKINWLSSIPDKYKEDILKKVKEQTFLNEQQNVPQTPKKSKGRRRSQESRKRDMTDHELSKLKGLLGFQGANIVDQPAKDTTETFEVILNIKANKSPTKKLEKSKHEHKWSQPTLPRAVPRNFMPQLASGMKSLKSVNRDDKLPNLLRTIPNEPEETVNNFINYQEHESEYGKFCQIIIVIGSVLNDETAQDLTNIHPANMRNTY